MTSPSDNPQQDPRSGIDLLQSLPHALLALDADGVVVFGNRAARALCGTAPEGTDLIRGNAPWREAFGPRLLQQAMGDRTVVTGVVSSSDEMRIVSAGPRAGESGGWFVSSQAAPTPRGLEAEQVADRMGPIVRLAGGVAHDLNNVLGGLTGYVSLLKAKVAGGGHEHLFQMIDTACDRAVEVVNQLSEFAERRALVIQPLDLNEEVCEAVAGFAAEHETIPLRRRLTPELPSVTMDSAQLRQMILNICTVVARSLPANGALVVETGLSGEEREGRAAAPGATIEWLRLRVAPQAPGDYLPGLADAFRSRPPSGEAGLKLAIAQDILAAYGGKLTSSQSVVGGTEVVAMIPVDEDVQSDLSMESESRPPATLILVIDDEDIIRHMLQDSLEVLGYEGVYASSGEEGLEIFKKRRDQIGLALVDLFMPGMKGHEVMDELRRLKPDLKVILSTAHAFGVGGPNLRKKLASEELLLKPFRLHDLQARLEKVFGPPPNPPSIGDLS